MSCKRASRSRPQPVRLIRGFIRPDSALLVHSVRFLVGLHTCLKRVEVGVVLLVSRHLGGENSLVLLLIQFCEDVFVDRGRDLVKEGELFVEFDDVFVVEIEVVSGHSHAVRGLFRVLLHLLRIPELLIGTFRSLVEVHFGGVFGPGLALGLGRCQLVRSCLLVGSSNPLAIWAGDGGRLPSSTAAGSVTVRLDAVLEESSAEESEGSDFSEGHTEKEYEIEFWRWCGSRQGQSAVLLSEDMKNLQERGRRA
mmetsp:Transcript_75524/g.157536  ORF Transcript_75524/g.157536 Transcript_75524/m.157536 type:complete len:252 (+) Transcript_75524:93-848(+)